jgi:cytochrome b subunit of formate dehydrogenase
MKDIANRLIVTRHSTLERLSHYLIIISITGLLASGFMIYFGLEYLEYGQAYSIHIIFAAIFVSINFIVVPYSAFVNRALFTYVFWPKDYTRLIKLLKNFFSGGEYPKYTVYDMKKRRFVNKLHPAGKLLIYSYYVALSISTITGIVLYSTDLSIPGLNISSNILKIFDFISPSFEMSGLALVRLLHIAAAYWFVVVIILHAGMIQLDPKKAQHLKSIFIDGKVDVVSDPTAEIVNTPDD